MIIAPLVFATLVAGVAHMGDTAALGRVGARTMAWFITASLISLTLGLILVNTLQPGVGLNLPLPPVNAASGVDTSNFDLAKFVTHVVPGVGHPGDGGERDPADRRLLAVHRRCDHRGRRKGQAAGPRGRRAGRGDAGRHRLCHASGAARGVRRRRRLDRRKRPGRDPHLRPVHRQLLPRPLPPLVPAVRGRLPCGREPGHAPCALHPRSAGAGLLHRLVGSGLSAHAGSARQVRRPAAHRQLRAAAWAIRSISTAR